MKLVEVTTCMRMWHILLGSVFQMESMLTPAILPDQICSLPSGPVITAPSCVGSNQDDPLVHLPTTVSSPGIGEQTMSHLPGSRVGEGQTVREEL